MTSELRIKAQRGCDDALHILRMVVEKSNEWGEDLWVAALDAEKAFDKVSHEALFTALKRMNIHPHLVGLVKIQRPCHRA